MPALHIANARIAGTPSDIAVIDGRIAALGPNAAEVLAGVAHETLDARGVTAFPTLVDAHIHVDKTTWGGAWVSREPMSSMLDFITADAALQQRTRAETPVVERAGALMRHAVSRGTRAMRAQVDVAPAHGLLNVEGVAAARRELADALDVQIVAFPQMGILREPGTAELLERSIEAGADIVGGIDPIGVDGDLDGQLDTVFGIARATGAGIDFHLHDDGEIGAEQVLAIAERTARLGLQGRVTLGHVFAYENASPATIARMNRAVVDAGIVLVTVALGGEPVLPVYALRDAGVGVALGSDGVRDSWSPFGNAEMIERCHLLAYRLEVFTDPDLQHAFDIAAHEGARLMGLPESRLRIGDPADLMLADAVHAPQLIVDRPVPLAVVKAGRVVAREGRYAPGV
ncbi:amidohydrolase [Leucobacter iarius]|uniref:Amidohydrolase n=1 Tax=Leucobacter iarius TaxID=333963 RepID=A0ABN2LLJ2_9MICO